MAAELIMIGGKYVLKAVGSHIIKTIVAKPVSEKALEMARNGMEILKSRYPLVNTVTGLLINNRIVSFYQFYSGALQAYLSKIPEEEIANIQERLSDPAIIMKHQEALTAAIATDDPITHSLLAKLLADRIFQKEITTEAMAINGALETVPKLSPLSLRALAVIWLGHQESYNFKSSCPGIGSMAEYHAMIYRKWKTIIDPLVSGQKIRRQDGEYLIAEKCILERGSNIGGAIFFPGEYPDKPTVEFTEVSETRYNLYRGTSLKYRMTPIGETIGKNAIKEFTGKNVRMEHDAERKWVLMW